MFMRGRENNTSMQKATFHTGKFNENVSIKSEIKETLPQKSLAFWNWF